MRSFQRAVRYILGYVKYHIQHIRLSPPRILSVALSALGIATAVRELIEQIGLWQGMAVCSAVILLYLFLIVRNPIKVNSEEFPKDLRFRAQVPPTSNQHNRIAEACAYFGDSAIDPIQGAIACESDVFSTVALSDYKGREVGFADYYAYRREDVDRYISGYVSKLDFFSDYYLPHPEARDAEALYISTLFRYDHLSDRSVYGVKETAMLAWCLFKLIEVAQKEPKDGWLLVTAGGSSAGEKLIKHFKFLDSGRTDPDGNRIFTRDKVTIKELRNEMEKYSYLEQLVIFNVSGLSVIGN